MGNGCESITSHMGKGQLQHIWDMQTIESDSTNDYTSVIYENCAWHYSVEPLITGACMQVRNTIKTSEKSEARDL